MRLAFPIGLSSSFETVFGFSAALAHTRMRVRQEVKKAKFWEFRLEFQIFANSGQSSLPANARAKRGRPASAAPAKSPNHWLSRSFARILLQTSKKHGFCAILWSSKITLKRTRPCMFIGSRAKVSYLLDNSTLSWALSAIYKEFWMRWSSKLAQPAILI